MNKPSSKDKQVEEELKQVLINNTLGISTYDPRMKNIIIDLDHALSQLLNLIKEENIKELEKRIEIWEQPRQPKITEINQNPSIAWDNGHNCAVNTIIRGTKERIKELSNEDK